MALNSWPFLVLAACAILIVPASRGRFRTSSFLAINLIFVWSYWGRTAMATGLAFCVAGFAFARIARGRAGAVLAAGLAAVTVAFVWLRGYTWGGAAPSGEAGAAGVVAIAGLSFLFFKIVHVVVDASSGSIERLPFTGYLNYCLNFTTFLMGPIQRYQDFAAQWSGQSAPAAGLEAYADATNRVLRGLVKAFVIAPIVVPYLLEPGRPIERMGAEELLLGLYSYYIYLYLDFSGYCDIVIGIGVLMGVKPPENFRFPFLSRNVSEYWLRVHRSLTTWLTDYVFTPAYRFALGTGVLGQRGFLALASSLLLTMIVAGVWHGTAPSFLVFGVIHGVALVVVRGYEQVMVRRLGRARFKAFSERPLVTAAAVFLTFNFTSLAYVLFVLDVDESVRVFERLAVTAGIGR
jgi:D-alanyl-lipoteichoic acid acyltransferase DltB (MBOAT superfamily)